LFVFVKKKYYFLPLFSACYLKIWQVGWGLLVDSPYKVSPKIIYDWVQVQALGWVTQGHSQS